jgi:DNA-binding XRE family transcriptional regulator
LPVYLLVRKNGAHRNVSGSFLPIGGVVDDVVEVGEGIRAARREAGITQKDLAELSGVSERTVRAIESGTGNPSLRAVAAVAGAVGLRLRVL